VNINMDSKTMKMIVALTVLMLLAGCVTQKEERAPSVSKSNTVMDHQDDFYVAHKGLEDGYELIFHIMPAPEGTGYSHRFYHLMVSVIKDGKTLRNITLYSAVKHPDGHIVKQTAMMRMGDWYMARYDLSHEQGRHWLTVSFVVGGKHYESGVYYPEIDFR